MSIFDSLFRKPSPDYDVGIAAFKKGDYALAAKHLRPFAEGGNAEAQFVMAEMYAGGLGVPQNMEISRELVVKAAKQWHAGAFFLLGISSLIEAPKEAYTLLYTSAALSTARGNPAAAEEPRRMLSELAKRLTGGEVAEAERAAREAISAAAKGGYPTLRPLI